MLNNRQVVWESKAKQIGVVCVSFSFVALAIWTQAQYSTCAFWGTVLFFGVGGIGFLYRLLNPKNLFVTPNSALEKQILAEQFAVAQADMGPFSFVEGGFLLLQEIGTAYYKWADLETVFGYKRDEYVTDEICLDLFFGNTSHLNLTEATAGWYQFLIKLHENVSSIPLDWQIVIAVPVFETKLTLLFDKSGRTQAQAELLYYKD